MDNEFHGNELPYFQAVPSSPDEGELSDGNTAPKTKIKSRITKTSADDEESRLRKKLLEKRDKGQKIVRPRVMSAEDEEMFAMQPGVQESKRQEAASSRLKEHKGRHNEASKSREHSREKDSSHKEKVNHKEESKMLRKPIEWKVPKEKEKIVVTSKLSTKMEIASRISDHRSESSRGSSSSSHGRNVQGKYQSRTPEKRRHKDEGHSRDVYRKTEKYSKRESSEHRSSSHSKDRSKKSALSAIISSAITSSSKEKTTVVKTVKKSFNELEEIRSSSSSPSPSKVSDVEKSSSASPASPKDSLKSEDPAMDEDESPLNEPVAPTEIKKYSKFESSPENEDFSDDEDASGLDQRGLDDEEINQEGGFEPESDVDDLSALEKKGFDQLTDEEKALLSPDTLERMEGNYQKKLISQLPVYYPGIAGCRNVAEFECLNRIEEGTFGVVYRASEKKTGDVVALKRLKMEKEREGFPITSLREINMLLKCGTHPNIVNVREIVVGSNMDKIYLVMEFVEHDMKSLMELMKSRDKTFTIPQVKTLLKQLLSGIEHMHEEYVIHRDLKTSNLLLSHKGILKIGDFGLAREFGSPLKAFTPIVVTLWYRSPELLLGINKYSTAVDMWSVGCIFGEFLKLKPLFPGKGEIDQLNKIFMEIGTPKEDIWPGYSELPGVRKFAFAESPFNQLRKQFPSNILPSKTGFDLLNRLLAPCPDRRISAAKALKNAWFEEDPLPSLPENFPTWPAKSEHNKKPVSVNTITVPAVKSNEPKPSMEKLKLLSELKVDLKHASKDGFALKFDAPKFK